MIYDTSVEDMAGTQAGTLAPPDVDRIQDKVLEGQLYCRNGAHAVAASHLDVFQKIAKVKLALLTEAPSKLEGAARSTPDFDLLLETPQADLEAHRARLLKEHRQLSKVIEEIDRQLGNEKFLKSAPSHIVDGLRQKRAEYQARLDKNLQ